MRFTDARLDRTAAAWERRLRDVPNSIKDFVERREDRDRRQLTLRLV
jgi:hypothetical protein